MAKSLQNCDSAEFWNHVKGGNKNAIPLAMATEASNCVGEKAIINMWKDHISNLLIIQLKILLTNYMLKKFVRS